MRARRCQCDIMEDKTIRTARTGQHLQVSRVLVQAAAAEDDSAFTRDRGGKLET